MPEALSIDEIKEETENFGANWMNIRVGEDAKFTVKSKTIHSVKAGEEGLDGSSSEYNRWQIKVEDSDGIARVLKVQKRLARAMIDILEDHGHNWDKHFENSRWYVERVDQFNWKVELLGAGNADDTGKKQDKAEDKPSEKKLKNNIKLSKQATEVLVLVEKNNLYDNKMTVDTFKTIMTSFIEGVDSDVGDKIVKELTDKNVINVDKDGNIIWVS